MSLRLLYLIFVRLVLVGRSVASKDAEMLGLRRTHPRPRLDWAYRAVLTPLIRLPTRLQLRAPKPDHPVADLSQERIRRRPVLGGLIKEYERAV